MGRLIGIARLDKKRAAMHIHPAAAIGTTNGVANDFRGARRCSVLQGSPVSPGDPVRVRNGS